MKILVLLILPVFAFSQPKKTNTIVVRGVTFRQAVEKGLYAGYTIEKIYSNFQTVRTDWKGGKKNTEWMKIRIGIRIKDSSAIITGDWYNIMFVCPKVFGKEDTPETAAEPIAYTFGNPKNCFKDLDAFAKTFN